MKSYLNIFLITLSLSLLPLTALGQEPENMFDLPNTDHDLANQATFYSSLESTSTDVIPVPQYTDFNKPTPITQAQAREILPYAQLALDTYSYRVNERNGWIRAEKDQLPEDIQDYYVSLNDPAKGKLLVDGYSGLQAAVWLSSDNKKVALAFAGTDLRMLSGEIPSARFFANLNSYIWFYLGFDNIPFLDESLIIAQAIKKHFPNKELIILGSSLSGAQAKYCAIATNSKAYTFNSLGLNAALHERLAQQHPLAYIRANQLITETDLQGDLVTESLPYQLTKYPLGTTYIVPSPTPSIANHMMNNVVKDLEHFLASFRPKTQHPKQHDKPTHIPNDPVGIDYVL